jgi:hypothetical protein
MLIGLSALWTNQDPTYAAPVSTIWCVESVAVKQLDAYINNHFANVTFAYHFANTGHDFGTNRKCASVGGTARSSISMR